MEIDFCLSSVPVEGEEIVWEPLITEEIFLVVPSVPSVIKPRKYPPV